MNVKDESSFDLWLSQHELLSSEFRSIDRTSDREALVSTLRLAHEEAATRVLEAQTQLDASLHELESYCRCSEGKPSTLRLPETELEEVIRALKHTEGLCRESTLASPVLRLAEADRQTRGAAALTEQLEAIQNYDHYLHTIETCIQNISQSQSDCSADVTNALTSISGLRLAAQAADGIPSPYKAAAVAKWSHKLVGSSLKAIPVCTQALLSKSQKSEGLRKTIRSHFEVIIREGAKTDALTTAIQSATDVLVQQIVLQWTNISQSVLDRLKVDMARQGPLPTVFPVSEHSADIAEVLEALAQKACEGLKSMEVALSALAAAVWDATKGEEIRPCQLPKGLVEEWSQYAAACTFQIVWKDSLQPILNESQTQTLTEHALRLLNGFGAGMIGGFSRALVALKASIGAAEVEGGFFDRIVSKKMGDWPVRMVRLENRSELQLKHEILEEKFLILSMSLAYTRLFLPLKLSPDFTYKLLNDTSSLNTAESAAMRQLAELRLFAQAVSQAPDPWLISETGKLRRWILAPYMIAQFHAMSDTLIDMVSSHFFHPLEGYIRKKVVELDFQRLTVASLAVLNACITLAEGILEPSYSSLKVAAGSLWAQKGDERFYADPPTFFTVLGHGPNKLRLEITATMIKGIVAELTHSLPGTKAKSDSLPCEKLMQNLIYDALSLVVEISCAEIRDCFLNYGEGVEDLHGIVGAWPPLAAGRTDTIGGRTELKDIVDEYLQAVEAQYPEAADALKLRPSGEVTRASATLMSLLGQLFSSRGSNQRQKAMEHCVLPAVLAVSMHAFLKAVQEIRKANLWVIFRLLVDTQHFLVTIRSLVPAETTAAENTADRHFLLHEDLPPYPDLVRSDLVPLVAGLAAHLTCLRQGLLKLIHEKTPLGLLAPSQEILRILFSEDNDDPNEVSPYAGVHAPVDELVGRDAREGCPISKRLALFLE